MRKRLPRAVSVSPGVAAISVEVSHAGLDSFCPRDAARATVVSGSRLVELGKEEWERNTRARSIRE